jgi:RNA ligase
LLFESGVRVKVKFDEYIRLHRLITGVNAKTIWDLMRNNQSFEELMERVPDEFYSWVQKTRKDLDDEYTLAESVALRDWEAVKDLPSRKEQAEAIFKIDSDREKKLSNIIFKILDPTRKQFGGC